MPTIQKPTPLDQFRDLIFILDLGHDYHQGEGLSLYPAPLVISLTSSRLVEGPVVRVSLDALIVPGRLEGGVVRVLRI